MNGITPLAVLTIAGSDSSGGAGIQADLKTFTAFGCYGTSAITALTAQNTTGVQGVHATPPDFLEQQLRSVLDDIDVRAIKTGMLLDAANTQRVASTLKAHYGDVSKIPALVVDPVSVSTSGHMLLHPDAVDVMIQELFPLATVITPNKPETELLLSRQSDPVKIETLEAMVSASERLLAFGSKAVLVKGGHIKLTLADVNRVATALPGVTVVHYTFLDENMEILRADEKAPFSRPLVVDVLREGTGVTLFVSLRIDSTSTHGTGCTLAAAIASVLSQGQPLVEATRKAIAFTHVGIETAFPIGQGHGPLNHMHSLTTKLVPTPTDNDPHPLTRILIQSCKKTWKEYVEHDFVKELGRGTLSKERFLYFIKQDYLYLKYYARAYGLLVAKSSSYDTMKVATKNIISIVNEVATHKSYSEKWGLSEAELAATVEAPTTTAYGAYLLDVGLQGDSAQLIMSLAACLLGYGEVGLWLKKEAAKPDSWVKIEGNPYRKWIEDYSGEGYQTSVRLGIKTLEALAVDNPPNALQFQQWSTIWARCTKFEKGFWDAALEML